jgi:hypothetical protein
MSADALIGCIVIASALSLIASLVLWSRGLIHRIDRRGARSARAVLTELREEE